MVCLEGSGQAATVVVSRVSARYPSLPLRVIGAEQFVPEDPSWGVLARPD